MSSFISSSHNKRALLTLHSQTHFRGNCLYNVLLGEVCSYVSDCVVTPFVTAVIVFVLKQSCVRGVVSKSVADPPLEVCVSFELPVFVQYIDVLALRLVHSKFLC